MPPAPSLNTWPTPLASSSRNAASSDGQRDTRDHASSRSAWDASRPWCARSSARARAGRAGCCGTRDRPERQASPGVITTMVPDSVMSSERISSLVRPAARPAVSTSDIAITAFFTGAAGSNGGTKESERRSDDRALVRAHHLDRLAVARGAEAGEHRAERRRVRVARRRLVQRIHDPARHRVPDEGDLAAIARDRQAIVPETEIVGRVAGARQHLRGSGPESATRHLDGPRATDLRRELRRRRRRLGARRTSRPADAIEAAHITARRAARAEISGRCPRRRARDLGPRSAMIRRLVEAAVLRATERVRTRGHDVERVGRARHLAVVADLDDAAVPLPSAKRAGGRERPAPVDEARADDAAVERDPEVLAIAREALREPLPERIASALLDRLELTGARIVDARRRIEHHRDGAAVGARDPARDVDVGEPEPMPSRRIARERGEIVVLPRAARLAHAHRVILRTGRRAGAGQRDGETAVVGAVELRGGLEGLLDGGRIAGERVRDDERVRRTAGLLRAARDAREEHVVRGRHRLAARVGRELAGDDAGDLSGVDVDAHDVALLDDDGGALVDRSAGVEGGAQRGLGAAPARIARRASRAASPAVACRTWRAGRRARGAAPPPLDS